MPSQAAQSVESQHKASSAVRALIERATVVVPTTVQPTNVATSPAQAGQGPIAGNSYPGTLAGRKDGITSKTSPFLVKQDECKLISGPVAISAQAVLLSVVVLALIFKRSRERPRRPFNVWLLDIGKQACSATCGHIVGMSIAIIVHTKYSQYSECGWYFVTYWMDCIMGLTLAITFHKIVTGVARWQHLRQKSVRGFDQEHPWWEALVEIGNYGDAAAPNMRKWAIQVVCWVSCVVAARLIVGITLTTFAPAFTGVTAFLDAQFHGSPTTYLYCVMVCIPLVTNIGQAWVQDQVLKWKHKKLPSEKSKDLPTSSNGTRNGPSSGGSNREYIESIETKDGAITIQLLVPTQRNR